MGRTWASAVTIALLVSTIAHRAPGVAYLRTFVLVLAIYVFSASLTRQMLNRPRRNPEAEWLDEVRDSVAHLTADAAQELALTLLRNREAYECTQAECDPPRLPELPSKLTELLRTYRTIGAVSSSAVLGHEHVGASGVLEGFLRCGWDTAHTEIAFRPGEDTVYVLADDVPASDCKENELPSIFHYLIYKDRVQAGLRSRHARV